MTTQDFVALAVCVAALLWLVHRLILRYLPAAKRPDVTTARLVRRSRERRGCHESADRL